MMRASRSTVRNVLVVGPMQSVRKMISVTLRDAGYRVLEAENPGDGAEKARGINVDLVIVDRIAEKSDCPGHGAVSYGAAPVLALLDVFAFDGIRSGTDKAWIAKPFTGEEVLAAVRSIIGN